MEVEQQRWADCSALTKCLSMYLCIFTFGRIESLQLKATSMVHQECKWKD